jgi:hypothetical protein
MNERNPFQIDLAFRVSNFEKTLEKLRLNLRKDKRIMN